MIQFIKTEFMAIKQCYETDFARRTVWEQIQQVIQKIEAPNYIEPDLSFAYLMETKVEPLSVAHSRRVMLDA